MPTPPRPSQCSLFDTKIDLSRSSNDLQDVFVPKTDNRFLISMNRRSGFKPVLAESLSVILPGSEETLLLRTCLLSAESAQQAWDEWQFHRKERATTFLGDDESINKLRPSIFHALRRHGITVDKANQTYLRSAYLKEELRSKVFRRICRATLLLLRQEGIPAILLKGAALAETIYDCPVLRHCHDIDLLLPEEEINRVASLLVVLGFSKDTRKSQPQNFCLRLLHESRLPLELHTELFQIPYYNRCLDEIRERSHDRLISGVSTPILAPSDSLLHVCGHAFCSDKRESLRWVTDAWLLIDRHRDLDWELFLECARKTRLLLPLSVTLNYLAESLDAAIPSTFLHRLFEAASSSNSRQREFALSKARSSPNGSFRNLLAKAIGWRGRAFVIQWMLFPSPSYLIWEQRINCLPLLPFHYLYRPLRYIVRRIRVS